MKEMEMFDLQLSGILQMRPVLTYLPESVGDDRDEEFRIFIFFLVKAMQNVKVRIRITPLLPQTWL